MADVSLYKIPTHPLFIGGLSVIGKRRGRQRDRSATMDGYFYESVKYCPLSDVFVSPIK
jgi:hypothetical protein